MCDGRRRKERNGCRAGSGQGVYEGHVRIGLFVGLVCWLGMRLGCAVLCMLVRLQRGFIDNSA